MDFQLLEIILWPMNQQEGPRVLPFSAGKVNVITGSSKTGKSAIIPIVDYCLGADRCTIPVGIIRTSCAWFGIKVRTRTGQKLLARRAPLGQRASSDMFLMEGKQIDVPARIDDTNRTLKEAKRFLDELAGLTNLNFATSSIDSGFRARPGFRDLVAFLFQPQNVVANPNVLFYKTETYEHQEKLRSIFPYVLGAVSASTLGKQHELRRLERELRQKEDEQKAAQIVSARWLADMKNHVSYAKELGLLPLDTQVDGDFNSLYRLLRSVAAQTSISIEVGQETVTAAVRELAELQNEESCISSQLQYLRRRLADMAKLQTSAEGYGHALGVKRERLGISDWLLNLSNTNTQCPICGGEQIETLSELAVFHESLRETETQAGSFEQVPAAFDREFNRVQTDIDQAVDRLKAVRIRINGLERVSEEAKAFELNTSSAWRFLGVLQQTLAMLDEARRGNGAAEIERLKARIRTLRADISKAAAEQRLAQLLERIAYYAARTLPLLDCERLNDQIRLSIDDLNVAVMNGEDDGEGEDYLWEIGSAANWVSYHIAVMIALQTLFCETPSSPIPSLLIFDQPSQAWFPHHLMQRAAETEDTEPLLDVDVDAVRRVYKALNQAVCELEGKLQIIVLDHAPTDVWSDLNCVDLVEEWRDGHQPDKLVPANWQSTSE